MDWLSRFTKNLVIAMLIEAAAVSVTVYAKGTVFISPAQSLILFGSFGVLQDWVFRPDGIFEKSWLPWLIAVLAWPLGAIIGDLTVYAVIVRFFTGGAA